MTIEIKKQTIEVIEFKTPAYYKANIGHEYVHVNNEGAVMTVFKRSIHLRLGDDGEYRDREISELFTGRYSPCTVEDFECAYAQAMDVIIRTKEANPCTSPLNV